VTPDFYPLTSVAEVDGPEAVVLIGDPAIQYAATHAGEPMLDLGAAWWRLTGLPFVYAVWAVQRGRGDRELTAMLRAAKTAGLAHLEEIVQSAPQATAEFRREYLRRFVCFDLGEAEKQGLRRFQEYLWQLGLVGSVHGLRYVS